MNAQSFKRKIQGYVGSYVNFNEEQRITFRLVYAGPVNDVPNRYRQVFSINGVSSEDSVLATRTQCLVFNVAAVEQIQPLDGNKFEQYNTSSGEINQTTPISHWDIGVTYNIGKSGFNEPCVVMYSNFGTKQNIEDGIPLTDELIDNDSPQPSDLLDFITVAYDCKEIRSIVDREIAEANRKFISNELNPISWELVKQKISEDFPFLSAINCSRIYTHRLAKESGYKPCPVLEVRCVTPKLQNSPIARYSAFYNLLGETVILDGTKNENTPGIVLGSDPVTQKQKALKKKDKKFSQEELEEYCASTDHLHEALVAVGSCYGLILQDLNLHALTPPLSGVNAQYDWFVIHEHGSIGSSDYYSVSLDFNDDPGVVKVEVCYRHFTRSGEYVKQKTKIKYDKVNKASKVETLYFNAAKILVNMAQARLMLD